MPPVDKANAVVQVAPPIAVEAYRLHVNLDATSYALLGEAQDLLSHKLPQGDVGGVIGLALAALVDQLQRRKHGRLKSRTSSPLRAHPSATIDGEAAQSDGDKASRNYARTEPVAGDFRAAIELGGRETLVKHGDRTVKVSRTRTPSRVVKRTVYERDAGACTYVAANGRRCGARTMLEYHHIHAFGLGGCNEADNVTLHCRTHNALAAVRDFGAAHQARVIGNGGRVAMKPESLREF